MEWQSRWTDPFQQYLKSFAGLIGDRRTWQALLETVKGIIASGSAIGQRIASVYLTEQDVANWKDEFDVFAHLGSRVPVMMRFLEWLFFSLIYNCRTKLA